MQSQPDIPVGHPQQHCPALRSHERYPLPHIDHVSCIKYLLYFDSDYDKLQAIKNSRGKLAKDLTVNKKPFENVITAAKVGDVNLVRKMISENGELKNICTH